MLREKGIDDYFTGILASAETFLYRLHLPVSTCTYLYLPLPSCIPTCTYANQLYCTTFIEYQHPSTLSAASLKWRVGTRCMSALENVHASKDRNREKILLTASQRNGVLYVTGLFIWACCCTHYFRVHMYVGSWRTVNRYVGVDVP